MNAYSNQYQQQQQYQQNQIYTATPEQILIMLYDGAIRFTRQAMMAGEQGNQVQKLERISKTMAIIVEFSNTLNRVAGGFSPPAPTPPGKRVRTRRFPKNIGP